MIHWAFQVVLAISGKEPACQSRRRRNTGSVPGWGRAPGEGHGNPLQYSCQENPMDREVCPWTVACQAPLSIAFSRQEYWSGLPCPSPGALPDAGIELESLVSPELAGRFFTTSTTSGRVFTPQQLANSSEPSPPSLCLPALY